MLAVVWVPVRSPEANFQDKSLVYLRGRLILPLLSEDSSDDEDESQFMVFIEVIRASFKRLAPSVHWTAILRQVSVLPETLIIGKIVESTIGTNRSLMLLIRTRDEVREEFEDFLIA